jgi:hypothetical protein
MAGFGEDKGMVKERQWESVKDVVEGDLLPTDQT